jgi:hypothetical protein
MTRRDLTFLLFSGALSTAVPVLAFQRKEDRSTLGLKEALTVATGNAISSTGKLNGYFKNKAIKILMPRELAPVEKLLRTFGQGDKVDEFVKSMNRSAERAAPQAGKFFTDAIKELTFDDVRKILTGGDTAATDFFERKTGDKIATAFSPIVKNEMDKIGVARQFKDLTEKARALPFGEAVSLDIDEYVVNKAVSGLFHVMGEEERKIRRDPVARVTDILKDVFGNLR